MVAIRFNIDDVASFERCGSSGVKISPLTTLAKSWKCDVV
jgi:hypothetical protein